MVIIVRKIRELGGYEPRETLTSHQYRSITRGSKKHCNGLSHLKKLSINDPPSSLNTYHEPTRVNRGLVVINI